MGAKNTPDTPEGADKPASAAAVEVTEFEVTSPLEHDQVRYEPGDTVKLTAVQAGPMLGNTVKMPEAKLPVDGETPTGG